MDLLTAHKSATRQFDTRVRLVRDAQWNNATPCADWSVRDLVGHVVADLLWAPELLAGNAPAEVADAHEGDLLGADPVAAWAAASVAAQHAWASPGALRRTVALPGGDTPVEEYLGRQVLELTVHAWDLARGIDADDAMPNDLIGTVLTWVQDHAEQIATWDGFAPPLDISACTDDQWELLARLGRSPWKKFKPVDFRSRVTA